MDNEGPVFYVLRRMAGSLSRHLPAVRILLLFAAVALMASCSSPGTGGGDVSGSVSGGGGGEGGGGGSDDGGGGGEGGGGDEGARGDGEDAPPAALDCAAPLEESCEREYDPGISVRCTGCPPMYEGKLCATTTRYDDLTEGSCGMGVPPNWPDEVPATWWTKTAYTAAVDGAFFAGGVWSVSWCPENGVCGECYRLTPTGGYPDHAGSGAVGSAPQGAESIIVMITDDCPGRDAAGNIVNNAPWCTQRLSPEGCCGDPAVCSALGNTNQLGYAAHFDLQDANGQVARLGWDNVEVTFEPADCAEWWAQAGMDKGEYTGWSNPPSDPPSECEE